MKPGSTLYLGPTADWIEDDDSASFEHLKHQVAQQLVLHLRERIDALTAVQVSVEVVAVELRRQMAECAVDGNLVRAGDIGEQVWGLMQYQKRNSLL